MRPFFLLIISFFTFTTAAQVPGYRGIWFELNQKYPYGDKYSGGLSTYTAKHMPLAIYSPKVDKTFFVYGGTTEPDERHLLAMIGEYDHKNGKVTRPKVVFDKETVNDPHDNPSLFLAKDGTLWVFVSGRAKARPGIVLKSTKPYDISQFEEVRQSEFTYPQIHNYQNGAVHFFTKYTGVRELYFEQLDANMNSLGVKKLAGIVEPGYTKAGHYQVSAVEASTGKMATFFNRHIDGDPDKRTDLFYMESSDGGETWQTASGHTLDIPLGSPQSEALVYPYFSEKKNVYMKDMAFDEAGHPICLYLTSKGHEPGPENGPYEWMLSHWDGKKWMHTKAAESDHNYDMGSLFIKGNGYFLAIPTENPPQANGVGGEIGLWESIDHGKTWKLKQQLTQNSPRNHGYIRKVVNGQAPFEFLWTDGDPHEFSESHLYFGDFEGHVFQLPYSMKRKKVKVTNF